MRERNRLSATAVNKKKKPGRYSDGNGLYLQISQWGTKAWLFRYMLDGRARQMGLGSVDTFSLAEARDRAKAARQLLADGTDPLDAKQEARDAKRIEAAKTITFRHAAERYLKAHRPAWKKPQGCGPMAQHANQLRLPRVRRFAGCRRRYGPCDEGHRTDLGDTNGDRKQAKGPH